MRLTKKVALGVVALLVLAGCSQDYNDSNPGNKIYDTNELPVPAYRVNIDGMDCLAVKSPTASHDSTYYVWSIDCDWGSR